MILTSRMWNIKQRIDFLALRAVRDPGDYLIRFELDELTVKFNRLMRIEKLGLRVLEGGRSSSSSTEEKPQAS